MMLKHDARFRIRRSFPTEFRQTHSTRIPDVASLCRRYKCGAIPHEFPKSQRATGKLPTGENTNDAYDPLVIIDPFQPDIPADRALILGDQLVKEGEAFWNTVQDAPAPPEETDQHRPWWKLW
jgi:hypothetical protein